MKTNKGFSIGEVLLAMFILLVGMVDAIFLTARSIGDMTDSRAAVVATLLAQEGVELVRNVRDNTVTEDCGGERCLSFDDEYGFPGGSGGTCVIDYNTSDKSSHLRCSGVDDERLYFDHDLYRLDVGTPTEFYRRIYIQYSNAASPATDDDKIARITSVVVFGGKDAGDIPAANDVETDCKISQHCVFAQTRLTSWINYGD